MAHMLEERGLPTTVLALVLPQVEKTRPPRAVATPFMLGRPVGEPGDAAFQLRVLKRALLLLERKDGPVILEHFPDDPPGMYDRPGWLPAVKIPEPVSPRDAAAWAAALRAEMALVQPAWDRFKARFGRTTVGLSDQPPDVWPDFAASFLDGALPSLPLHHTPAVALRFAADDVKALYGEAAQADGGPPSPHQIDEWFWCRTVAGRFLIALRSVALASPNATMKVVGARFLVPRQYVPS
jgi:hypothetical protein